MIEVCRLQKNIYKPGSPIVVLDGGIFQENIASPCFVAMTMQNISNKVISSIAVDIHIFDRTNSVIEIIRDFVYYCDSAVRDTVIGGNIFNYLSCERPTSLAVALKAVYFEGDEPAWQGSKSLLFETIPQETSLENILFKSELVEQYQRDFLTMFASKQDVEAKYLPFKHRDIWECSCGQINHENELKCHNCEAEFVPQLEYLENPKLIGENLDNYKIQNEQQKLRYQQQAEEMQKKKLEKEEREKEAQLLKEEEENRKVKSKKTKERIIMVVLILIIMVCLVYFAYTYLFPRPVMENIQPIGSDFVLQNYIPEFIKNIIT